MNKKSSKAHEKNERADSPTGLLGVPPDRFEKTKVLRGQTVIIVDGDLTILTKDRHRSLPQ